MKEEGCGGLLFEKDYPTLLIKCWCCCLWTLLSTRKLPYKANNCICCCLWILLSTRKLPYEANNCICCCLWTLLSTRKLPYEANNCIWCCLWTLDYNSTKLTNCSSSLWKLDYYSNKTNKLLQFSKNINLLVSKTNKLLLSVNIRLLVNKIIHPSDPGSNSNHTIYAFCSLLYCICRCIRKRTKINKRGLVWPMFKKVFKLETRMVLVGWMSMSTCNLTKYKPTIWVGDGLCNCPKDI